MTALAYSRVGNVAARDGAMYFRAPLPRSGDIISESRSSVSVMNTKPYRPEAPPPWSAITLKRYRPKVSSSRSATVSCTRACCRRCNFEP